MRRLIPLMLVAAFLAVPGGSAQEPATALYMTDDAGDTFGSDARLLSPDEPTGDASTLQFSPATGQPADTYDWVTGGPVGDDLLLSGQAEVTLYFGEGADVASTTTVTILALDEDGTERELGSATDDTAGQAAPHEEVLTVDVSGKVVGEGEAVLLRVSVTDAAAIVQLQYGGGDAASGITDWPASILDSDGDGVGDSEERRQGTDPDDASDGDGPADNGTAEPDEDNATEQGDSNAGGGDTGGQNDGDGGSSAADDSTSSETLLASLFLLICLATAGIALLGRFPA